MRPELETYHIIDRYLNGELQGEELSLFEKRVGIDAEFAQEVELQKMTNLVVAGAAFDKLRQQMKADIRALDEKKSVWRKIFVGGSLVICAGTGYYFYTSSENVLETTQPIIVQQDKPGSKKSVIPPEIQLQEKKTVQEKNTKIEKSTTSRGQANTTETPLFSQHSEPVLSPVPFENKSQAATSPTETAKATSPHSPIIQDEPVKEAEKPSVVEKVEKKEVEPGVQAVAKHHRFTIQPSDGINWKIPAIDDKPYVLTIYNSAGQMVFKHNSLDYHLSEWEGISTNGGNLDAGIYGYVIEYQNNKIESGQITLIK